MTNKIRFKLSPSKMLFGILSAFSISTFAQDSAMLDSGNSLSAAKQQDIRNVIQGYLDKGQIPGAVTIFARDGEVIFSDVRGYQDIEGKTPLKMDSIFRFYSMTKPLTCAAVMTLKEDGLIDFNEPIKKYIPEMSTMSVHTESGVRPAENEIKIENLMTHTSGFSYKVIESTVSPYYADADVFAIENRLEETLAEHMIRLAKMPLYAEPGTEWHYGESMGVLGRLIEVASGMSFRDYIKERILEPTGMHDTDFFVPAEKADRLTSLYVLNGQGKLVDAKDGKLYGSSYLKQPVLEYGGAGIVGTPGDYLRFGEMLLNKGTIDGVRVLSPESVSAMTTNHLPEIFGENSSADPAFGFGYCGEVKTVPTSTINVGEYGWGGWASTSFWIDPTQNLTGLVFTQVIPDVLGTFMLTNDIREQFSK